MGKINSKLWADEILNQTIVRLKFGKSCYSEEAEALENVIEKHKYFAFRVPNIEEAEQDKDQLVDFSAKAARGLAMAIESDLIGFIIGQFFDDEILLSDSVSDTLKMIHDKKIVFYGIEDMRVQAAYDLDFSSNSVVGDWKYKIGRSAANNTKEVK